MERALPAEEPPAFGALLKRLRLAAGLTQERLAERAGLSPRAIAALEGGERQTPHQETVELLAKGLGLGRAERERLAAAVERRRGPAPPRPGETGAPSPPPLPHALTSFVGRERELGVVADLLASARLVTLTGPGGVGKTRLALEVARGAAPGYPDGVWLAELAALADPALVPQAAATALGARERPGEALEATLAAALRERRPLLLLDNCEHLLDACARLADALLRACPGLTILATSREPLGLAGEVAWRVPSLALPGSDLPSPEELARAAAARLFLERAAAARPGFALTERNAAAVAAVCRRLDGIPLAIELAAACLRALPAAELAARLDQRFRLLTGGSRAALPRQQTLRATLDWSHDLLAAPERRLLARLAVFAGGFGVAAAEAVGAGEGIAREDVLGLLMRLADKSMAQAEEHEDGAARYRLLETVRQYARERLVARGEAEALHDQHAAYFLDVAERAASALEHPRERAWLDRLAVERDNLRGALEWYLGRGDAERGIRLAAALGESWFSPPGYTEGYAWLERALALPGGEPFPRARATALRAAGSLAHFLGDNVLAQERLEESVALCRRLGDARNLARTLLIYVAPLLERRDPTARRVIEESLELFRNCDDRVGIASALTGLAILATRAGDHARAAQLLEEALALRRREGDLGGEANALARLGQLALARGDLVQARAWFERMRAGGEALGGGRFPPARLLDLALLAEREGDVAGAAARFEEGLTGARADGQRAVAVAALQGLGRLARRRDDEERAQVLFREALELSAARGDAVGTLRCLCELAESALRTGGRERAARLFAAAAALRNRSGMVLGPGDPDAYDPAEVERHVAALRSALGDGGFATAWAAGQAMALEQAIACGLGAGPSI